LQHTKGDVLEIGAHSGATTKIFCDIGTQHNCHVYVIDPWDGRQQGDNDVFQTFQKNTAECLNLTVYHTGSEDPQVLKDLQGRGVQFAFILIDGMHSYKAVKNDLKRYKELLKAGGVICIDDWTGPYGFSAEIRKATTDHLDDNYHALDTPGSFIERYFVRLT
jgi:cephalosporin hydroxylase